MDFADEKTNPDFYIGSYLIARRPTDVFTSPKGTKIKTFQPGAVIGRVYSWNMRDGFVWWELEPDAKQFGTWPNGTAKTAFVLHVKGQFDSERMVNTASGKTLEEERAARERAERESIGNVLQQAGKDIVKGSASVVSGAGDTLKMFGNLLPILIVLAIVIFLYLQFKK